MGSLYAPGRVVRQGSEKYPTDELPKDYVKLGQLMQAMALMTDSRLKAPWKPRSRVRSECDTTTIEVMAVAKYGGADKLKLLREETDPVTERIVRSWAEDFDPTTPMSLGLVVDESGDAIVKEYVDSLKK